MFFGGTLFVVLSLSIYLVVDQMSKMPSYESMIEAQVSFQSFLLNAVLSRRLI